MRRRDGEVLVIGEERLDDGVLPVDEGREPSEAGPAVSGPPTAAEVPTGVVARVRRVGEGGLRLAMALGGGALLALGGVWLAIGAGSPEGSSSPTSDPVGAVPLVGERHQASRVERPAPERAGATQPKRPSGGGAAGKGEAQSDQDVHLTAPTPTESAPTAAPPTPSGSTMPTETADPAPAAPTPASAATVQREFGP